MTEHAREEAAPQETADDGYDNHFEEGSEPDPDDETPGAWDGWLASVEKQEAAEHERGYGPSRTDLARERSRGLSEVEPSCDWIRDDYKRSELVEEWRREKLVEATQWGREEWGRLHAQDGADGAVNQAMARTIGLEKQLEATLAVELDEQDRAAFLLHDDPTRRSWKPPSSPASGRRPSRASGPGSV
jgi:hypothetical protein